MQSLAVTRPSDLERPGNVSLSLLPGERCEVSAKVPDEGAVVRSGIPRRWARAASTRTPASCRGKPATLTFCTRDHGSPRIWRSF